jgi:hypothetical protein
VLVIPLVRLRGVCTGNESRSRTTSLVHPCAPLPQSRYRPSGDCGRRPVFSPWTLALPLQDSLAQPGDLAMAVALRLTPGEALRRYTN